MGSSQGGDLQELIHLVDTLKRVVIFEDYITVVSAVAAPPMGALLELDLSSYVSTTAEDVFLGLFLQPTANAYWQLYTSSSATIGTRIGMNVYNNTINVFNFSWGIQKMTTGKSIYYRSQRLSGGGNARWIIRLHGYTEPA
jgi:hypothetical protein